METSEQIIRYAIIDDDDIDRTVIESEAKKFPFLKKVAVFANAVEALEFISGSEPDVIFLDIEMPGLSGVQLLKQKVISSALPVLITSHPEFALEGFELHVFDYLLKPVSTERFSNCALRLRDFFQMKTKSYAFDSAHEKDCIIIKQGHEKHKISIPDILYLEAMKDYTKITTTTKPYLVLTTLNAMKERLPEDLFIQIHRSFVVNKNKVDAVKKNKVFIQARELPVGKLYKHAFYFSE